MRAALSHEFKTAIPAYDEKPRSKWIFDYSVQNTIVVSRTFFTQASICLRCLRSLARPAARDGVLPCLSMLQVEQEAWGHVHLCCVLVLQDVNEAFEELEEGNEDALKVCCMPTSTIEIWPGPALTVFLCCAANNKSLLCQH